jgi:hypothetical protein
MFLPSKMFSYILSFGFLLYYYLDIYVPFITKIILVFF